MLYKKSKFKIILLSVVLLTSLLGIATTFTDDFEISKNLEIYSNIYRNLNVYYVDEVDPEHLMENGLNAMLKSLDPYNTYIPAKEVAEFRSVITGHYGGLGAAIFVQDDYVTIAEVYPNSPAHKAGLRAGDQMKTAEGESLKGLGIREVSLRLRGTPGSKVNIEVIRPNERETLKLEIERAEVMVNNMPFYGIIKNNLGYIALTAFSQTAGKNVKTALMELKKQKKLAGVVLDLRGNTGGLLTEAVNVVNVFVEKGEVVVSIKGRNKDQHQQFKTLNKAVDTKIPLVVLVDEHSASASEIVAGALQDKDRAVIVGQKSFGKGLVQNTFNLAYGAKLKVTTARYYTPSGRCIQALNYKDGQAKQIPDSLKSKFLTKHGRVVYDGGGIRPDIEMNDQKTKQLLNNLVKAQHLFNFAVAYRSKHPKIAAVKDFKLGDKDFEDFITYLKSKDYDYNSATETALDQLEEKALLENYEAVLKEEINTMRTQLKQSKWAMITEIKPLILIELQKEIIRNYYFESGAIEHMLGIDREIFKAMEILKNKEAYQTTLSVKEK